MSYSYTGMRCDSDECFTCGGQFAAISGARPNAETDNSLIPRPSGRFPSSGSVLDETPLAVVSRCRGVVTTRDEKFRQTGHTVQAARTALRRE